MIRKSVLVSVVLVAVLLMGAVVRMMVQHPAASVLEPTAQPTLAAQEPDISLRLLRAETPEGLNGPTRYIYQVEGISLRNQQLAQVSVIPRGDGTVNRDENLLFAFIPSDEPVGTYRVVLQLQDRQVQTTIAYTWREQPIPTPSPVPKSAPTPAPTSTPTPSPVLTPAPAPRATAVSPPSVRTCLPWPREVATMLRVLSLPDGLCLMEKQGTTPSGVGYAYPSRTIEYWFPDSLPQYPLYVKPSESVTTRLIAEQVCVAHQHQAVIDAGLVFDYQYAWGKTPEGVDFLRATGWSLKDGVWHKDGVAQEYLRPSKQATQACATWYLTGAAYAPERSWAERWLPLPSQK